RAYPIAQVEGTPREAGARRPEQPRMRSSIACARCRRSKVKCVNNGVNTTCRACETTGRECTYPTPAVPGAGGAPTRRDPVVSGPQGSEGTAVSEVGIPNRCSFVQVLSVRVCPRLLNPLSKRS